MPGTPANGAELVSELCGLSRQLKIEGVLSQWSAAIKVAQGVKAPNAKAFLLVLDSNARTMEITGFRQDELLRASEEYLSIETLTADKPEVQVVLVSVDSLAALRPGGCPGLNNPGLSARKSGEHQGAGAGSGLVSTRFAGFAFRPNHPRTFSRPSTMIS